jgi:hypothetical protein
VHGKPRKRTERDEVDEFVDHTRTRNAEARPVRQHRDWDEIGDKRDAPRARC